MKTYQFRLKSTNQSKLFKMASAVNFVWNFCNQAAIEHLDKRGKWLSGYDLDSLTVGCSQDLGILSDSMTSITATYVRSRQTAKKRKLSWRSSKRSLGWIPFKGRSVKVKGETITVKGITFRFHKSREIEGTIKTGSFSQDSMGRWYVNFQCDVFAKKGFGSSLSVGIDLGLKTIATLSDGRTLSRENITNKYADRLAMAQRAGKKRLTKTIHAKIKNVRKDWNHKQTTNIVNSYDNIIVGNVSSSKLKKTRMAKSVSDAGWADFKRMLAYKAIALGIQYKEVNESFSTVTCSNCFERTGPSGLSALGVREWTCKCGAAHNRDVNAAKNILRFGHESPIKGGLTMAGVKHLNRLPPPH